MIATISFGAIAEWLLAAFVVGLAAGVALTLYLISKWSKK